MVGRVVATEEGLAVYSLVWRSEFALVEEAVRDLGIVRGRCTDSTIAPSAAELKSWQHRSLKYAGMRHRDSHVRRRRCKWRLYGAHSRPLQPRAMSVPAHVGLIDREERCTREDCSLVLT